MPDRQLREAGIESLPDTGHRTQAPAQTPDLRVMSLSCVYPNAEDPQLGVFVRSRLRHLAKSASVKVVAPIPEIDYARRRRGRRGIPRQEWDGPIEVFHPAWLYPPGGYSLNSILLFLRLLPLVSSIRKRYRFGIVDAHFAFPDGIVASLLARAFGVPFAVTLRGNETMHARYAQRRKLMAWSLRRASVVIALSEELRQLALSFGVESQRIRIIPNGVDGQTFYPRERARCRQKHGILPGGKVFLSAGSLIERKGHHRVIRAIAALRSTGLRADLIIAGGPGREGHYEEELVKLAVDLGVQGQVRFTGEVSPPILAELMSAADVFCLASSREGWPNVVHEAMACGIPVVAARVGAVGEMIPSSDTTQSGAGERGEFQDEAGAAPALYRSEYGFVVPPGDQVALESALREALAKDWDYRKISDWALARTWDHVAEEFFEALREQVGEKG